MAKDSKCSDCASEVEGKCRAPALQGVMEPDVQQGSVLKEIPVEVCRSVKILCSSDARWFVHK